MNDSQISVVPIEVVQDKRLTLEQTRVLIALFSFRNKVTNTVWPSRAAIAERTGMHPSNISSATTALVNLGWLTKDGVGGFSKATRYTLCVPDFSTQTTVAQQATVADAATVAQSAIQTVAERATQTVADQTTRKEQSIEQSIEQSKSKRVTAQSRSPVPSRPNEVTEQTWSDWLALRKAKRAPVSDTVVAMAQREADKAGLTLEAFLQIWCMRGSQGMQADWIKPAELQQYRPNKRTPTPENFAERNYGAGVEAL